MADNVAITAGSGTTIATDDIGGVHYQRVKLVNGTLDDSTAIVGDAQGLWVLPRRDLQRISVQSSGLTTASTAYTAGDQVGAQFTFANAARASGGSGMIVGCTLISAAVNIGAYDLVLTDSSITLAADNAVWAVSDADALKTVGAIQMGGTFQSTNNRFSQSYSMAMPYVCSGGTSLFGSLITRLGHTFFAAATDLQVILYVERN